MLVTVIVPCRNEKNHIEKFLKSIRRQEIEGFDLEIIIADGCSNDGTLEILTKLAKEDSRIHVVTNTKKITPSGLNLSIGKSKGDIILRMDVHTVYASNYIRNCVETLLSRNADNVGGPWRASGNNFIQRGIALAFQSPFSAGGAKSHSLNYEGKTDSVYLGCWRKITFEKYGLFDEELIRNQDDEHNLRIVRGGGTIWQNPAIQSWYYPRSSIWAMFRQYAQYGYWKVRVIQKHHVPASIRHLIPALFLIALFLSGISILFYPLGIKAFATLLGTYLIAVLIASSITCIRTKKIKYILILPLVFPAFHFGYGLGFLAGIFEFIIMRRNNKDAFSGLTR
jgi:succinoglycan biosynthesis protein ExoA